MSFHDDPEAGHASTWNYTANPGPDYLHRNGSAQRAVIIRSHAPPLSSLQSGGTLVRGSSGGRIGEYFLPFPEAPREAGQIIVQADLYGGGTDTGQFVMQPLVGLDSGD